MPVSLAEAKLQCRIAEADASRDDLLTQAIWDAAASIETLTGSRLSACTVQLVLDRFPDCSKPIDLGIYPVRTVTFVEYDDENGTEFTLNSGTDVDYWEDLSGLYPRISPTNGWPATQYGKPGSVRIVLAVGYSSSPPRDLCRAVLIRVAEYFENTGESITGTINVRTETTVKALTDSWRRRVL